MEEGSRTTVRIRGVGGMHPEFTSPNELADFEHEAMHCARAARGEDSRGASL